MAADHVYDYGFDYDNDCDYDFEYDYDFDYKLQAGVHLRRWQLIRRRSVKGALSLFLCKHDHLIAGDDDYDHHDDYDDHHCTGGWRQVWRQS